MTSRTYGKGYAGVTFDVVDDKDVIERVKTMPVHAGNRGWGSQRPVAPIMLALASGMMIRIDTSDMSPKRIHAIKTGVRAPKNYVRRRGFKVHTRTDGNTMYLWAENQQQQEERKNEEEFHEAMRGVKMNAGWQ